MVNYRKITNLLITLSICVIPLLSEAGATEDMKHRLLPLWYHDPKSSNYLSSARVGYFRAWP